MKITIKNLRENDCVCDALILPVIEGGSAEDLSLGTSVPALLKNCLPSEFHGKKNELLLLPSPAGIKSKKLLLVGLGRKEELTPEIIRQAGGKALPHLRSTGARKVALAAAPLFDLKLSPVPFIEGALLGLYTYDRYKKEKETKAIAEITVLTRPSRVLAAEIGMITKLSGAVCFARDLVNTPSNDMTPTHMARAAAALRTKKMTVSVIEKKEAEKLGMWSYLSVSKGSDEPPKFIVLDYRGSKKSPVVLIGKSVTFDSGGISIKPSDGLEKMKYDMAGGAAVLGVMKAVSDLGLPLHVVGILPATENLPGGNATRPGDVVRAITGTTIEIINTDAEGRMTLADAIGYAQRFRPAAIIDIATLTGACAIALGSDAIAMMGTDRSLIETMRQAAETTNEKVWEMPLFEEYREYLKSDIADIKNVGGRSGSLPTSARFLREFVGETPWVHLDIAGTAWTEKERPYTPRGASGIGLRLLFETIRRMA
ncbi:MAG: leucyl aminopeptidase [Nitrospiraceae bacterium]|nr:leucyl aminopeptidase [Nitrospiraceae bacterium]